MNTSDSVLAREAFAGFGEVAPAGPLTPQELLCQEAFSEYLRLVWDGEDVELEAFASRYPDCESELLDTLYAHVYFEQNANRLPARWPEVGEELLGFRLLCRLGDGGFARVYLAEQPALGNRRVVLKVSRSSDREARTLGRLKHRNIVPVHSVGDDPGRELSALCMPYLGQATLHDVLERAFPGKELPRTAGVFRATVEQKGLPEGVGESDPVRCPAFGSGTYVDAVLDVGRQLAEALAFVHAQSVCHRDLKPTNVLLSLDGTPMLLDFNLCDDPRFNATEIGGTLPYMAPEQLRAIPKDRPPDLPRPDGRSDMYSLGVILYELLTGKCPWGTFGPGKPTEQDRRRLLASQERGLPPIRQSNPDVDRSLERVIARCLAFDPAHRFASAGELVAALKRCQSPTRRALRWGRRRRLSLVGVTLGVFLTAALAFGAWSQQPTFAARQFEQGMKAYRDKDYHQAINALTDVLDRPSPPVDAYYYRGRAYLHVDLPEYARAAEDFRRAAELADADPVSKEGFGRAAACAAYAYFKLIKMEPKRSVEYQFRSLQYCKEAIDAGFAGALVYNNLGFIEATTASRSSEAIVIFTKALRLDSGLQAAYHNRARLDLKLAHLKAGKGYCPNQGIEDIEKAKMSGPATPELLYDAFCLYVWAHKAIRARNDYLDKARAEIQHLRDHKWFTRQMADDFFFRNVQEEVGVRFDTRDLPDQSQVPATRLFLDPVRD